MAKSMPIRRFNAPAASGHSSMTRGPRINNGRSFRITNREFLQDVNLTTTFDVFGFRIQPANTDTFPWLSQIACYFEQYKFRKLKFVYVPSCTTNLSGAMYMTTRYDARDLAPSTKPEFLDYKGSTQSTVWKGNTHDCMLGYARYMMKNFTLRGDIPDGADPQMYDVGNFFYANVGNTATLSVGELYVEYDVDLFTTKKLTDEIETMFYQIAAEGDLEQPFLVLSAPRTNFPRQVNYSAINNLAGSTMDFTWRANGFYLVEYWESYNGNPLDNPVIEGSTSADVDIINWDAWIGGGGTRQLIRLMLLNAGNGGHIRLLHEALVGDDMGSIGAFNIMTLSPGLDEKMLFAQPFPTYQIPLNFKETLVRMHPRFKEYKYGPIVDLKKPRHFRFTAKRQQKVDPPEPESAKTKARLEEKKREQEKRSNSQPPAAR